MMIPMMVAPTCGAGCDVRDEGDPAVALENLGCKQTALRVDALSAMWPHTLEPNRIIGLRHRMPQLNIMRRPQNQEACS